MEKLQSTFKNMVLSLVIICMVAASALAGVYILTLENIEAQKLQKQQAAILAVLPEGSTISDAEQVGEMTVYKGYDANGQWVGTAVETVENGFGGPIKVMVGFGADSKVINYVVLEHQETPGLGDKMATWFKSTEKATQSIIGKTANGQFTVNKDGGDIDAITAATISSRAFLTAINNAYKAFTNGEVEAVSGATTQTAAADSSACCKKANCEKRANCEKHANCEKKAECVKQCEKNCDTCDKKAECKKANCEKKAECVKKQNCPKAKETEVTK